MRIHFPLIDFALILFYHYFKIYFSFKTAHEMVVE